MEVNKMDDFIGGIGSKFRVQGSSVAPLNAEH